MDFSKYHNKLPYARKKDNEEMYYQHLAREQEILDSFKADLLAEHGVTNNPKAEMAYQKAWEHGHHAGLQEVAIYFEDFVELIK